MALGQLDVLGRQAGVGGDLGRRGLAVELAGQAVEALVDGAVRLAHVGRHPDRAALVGDGPADGLADPPRGVGRELEALAVVELLDRPHQPEVALLDEVEQRQAAGLVLAGDRHHEAEVGLDEAAPGVGRRGDVALELATARHRRCRTGRQLGLGGAAVGEQLAEVDLVGGGEERDGADLVEVLAQQRPAGTAATLGAKGHGGKVVAGRAA